MGGVLTYHLWIPFPGDCWFYSPAFGEWAPSELITDVAWLLATIWALKGAHQERWLFGVALFCFVLFLEESNYGKPFLGFLGAVGHDEGKAFHNLLEDKYQKAYWNVENGLQYAAFAVLYMGAPIESFLRTRNWRRALAAGTPGLIFLSFVFGEIWWEHRLGQPLYPHHPCVSFDEEFYETLFALAAWFLIVHRPTLTGRKLSPVPAP